MVKSFAMDVDLINFYFHNSSNETENCKRYRYEWVSIVSNGYYPCILVHIFYYLYHQIYTTMQGAHFLRIDKTSLCEEQQNCANHFSGNPNDCFIPSHLYSEYKMEQGTISFEWLMNK